jgi:hypothetical protein
LKKSNPALAFKGGITMITTGTIIETVINYFIGCLTNLPFRGEIPFQKFVTFGKVWLAGEFFIYLFHSINF